jgi:hypothetical protein
VGNERGDEMSSRRSQKYFCYMSRKNKYNQTTQSQPPDLISEDTGLAEQAGREKRNADFGYVQHAGNL